MKKMFPLIALLFLGANKSYGSDAKLEDVNAGAERLIATAARVNNLLDDAYKSKIIPGCLILIESDGKTEIKNHGYMGPNQPMREDAIFRLCSMSKAITMVAILKLIEKGDLELDTLVGSIIPSFRKLKILKGGKLVENKVPMTIKHLLTHTSGLGYGLGADYLKNEYEEKAVTITNPKSGYPMLNTSLTLEQFVDNVSRAYLISEPGESFLYGISTDILGRILEIKKQQPLDKVLKDVLFDPLGMVDTEFFVPQDKLDRLTTVYYDQTKYNTGFNTCAAWESPGDSPFVNDPILKLAGSGLVSTIQDYHLFAKMLLNKGGYGDKAIFQPQFFEHMITQLNMQTGSNSAHTSFLMDWLGILGTNFSVWPDHKTISIFMTQVDTNKLVGPSYQIKQEIMAMWGNPK